MARRVYVYSNLQSDKKIQNPFCCLVFTLQTSKILDVDLGLFQMIYKNWCLCNGRRRSSKTVQQQMKKSIFNGICCNLIVSVHFISRLDLYTIKNEQWRNNADKSVWGVKMSNSTLLGRSIFGSRKIAWKLSHSLWFMPGRATAATLRCSPGNNETTFIIAQWTTMPQLFSVD